MSSFGRSAVRFFILLWASYLALAQPGLPPCWLQARACEVHVHFSDAQAHSHHSHDYLFDLARADGAQITPVPLIPGGYLIKFLFPLMLFGILAGPALQERTWVRLPEPPPPRPFSVATR